MYESQKSFSSDWLTSDYKIVKKQKYDDYTTIMSCHFERPTLMVKLEQNWQYKKNNK